MNQPKPENHVSVADPDGIDCVLAAGDASDITEIKQWLETLPPTAYGQVFIEVFAKIQIQSLPLPANINVTWLVREQRSESPRPGIGKERGEALMSAVDAWFDEWLWADSDSGRNFNLWMGARTSTVMQSYWQHLDRRLAKKWPGFRGRLAV